jgi:hypothetical protein
VVVESRREISRARLRATMRDGAQLSLLVAVDYFFSHWPSTHIPLASRHTTLFVVAAMNAGVLTHVAMSRMMPKWAARRIASTWCLSERARFFANQRREQARY